MIGREAPPRAGREGSARSHQLHDRVRECTWGFLRQVVTGIRNPAVNPRAAELRRRRRTVACRIVAVGLAIQSNCRDSDDRLCRKLPFGLLVGRIAGEEVWVLPVYSTFSILVM